MLLPHPPGYLKTAQEIYALSVKSHNIRHFFFPSNCAIFTRHNPWEGVQQKKKLKKWKNTTCRFIFKWNSTEHKIIIQWDRLPTCSHLRNERDPMRMLPRGHLVTTTRHEYLKNLYALTLRNPFSSLPPPLTSIEYIFPPFAIQHLSDVYHEGNIGVQGDKYLVNFSK